MKLEGVKSALHRADISHVNKYDRGQQQVIHFQVLRQHRHLENRDGHTSSIKLENYDPKSLTIRYPTLKLAHPLYESKSDVRNTLEEVKNKVDYKNGSWDGYVYDSSRFENAYNIHFRVEFQSYIELSKVARIASLATKELDQKIVI